MAPPWTRWGLRPQTPIRFTYFSPLGGAGGSRRGALRETVPKPTTHHPPNCRPRASPTTSPILSKTPTKFPITSAFVTRTTRHPAPANTASRRPSPPACVSPSTSTASRNVTQQNQAYTAAPDAAAETAPPTAPSATHPKAAPRPASSAPATPERTPPPPTPPASDPPINIPLHPSNQEPTARNPSPLGEAGGSRRGALLSPTPKPEHQNKPPTLPIPLPP
jgi:hypothetical protein